MSPWVLCLGLLMVSEVGGLRGHVVGPFSVRQSEYISHLLPSPPLQLWDLLYKLTFVLTYMAPWQITWGSSFPTLLPSRLLCLHVPSLPLAARGGGVQGGAVARMGGSRRGWHQAGWQVEGS